MEQAATQAQSEDELSTANEGKGKQKEAGVMKQEEAPMVLMHPSAMDSQPLDTSGDQQMSWASGGVRRGPRRRRAVERHFGTTAAGIEK
jgi:hypothetical protein